MTNKKYSAKGFTLIELLVVVAIISLLSSVVLAALGTARVKARDAKRLTSAKQIQTALEIYYNNFGAYPSLDRAWKTATSEQDWSTTLATALRPYLSSLPNDPSMAGYLYKPTNNAQKYGLAVGFEGTSYNNLMTGDGGFYASFYEMGPSPAECKSVAKNWWVGGALDCP